MQAAGPRTGGNGKAFFDLEGSTAGGASFASFGVADFNFATLTPLGGTVTGVTGATLQLAQSNATFSVGGPISVYFTTNTGADIQPGTSPLKVQAGMDGAASIDPALAPLTSLGSGTYSGGPGTGGTPNGTVDSVSLTFSGSALTSLLSAINGGSSLRLVVTADSATTAATYAGLTHSTLAGPTLAFEAVLGTTPLAGDFDENGHVEGADLTNWKAGFGTAVAATHMQGDADADHDVDGADFSIWQQQLGSPAVAPAVAGVPEPSTFAMWITAIGGAIAVVAFGLVTRSRGGQ